jgi:hypothetical protein
MILVKNNRVLIVLLFGMQANYFVEGDFPT